jgi:hypothetical protein
MILVMPSVCGAGGCLSSIPPVSVFAQGCAARRPRLRLNGSSIDSIREPRAWPSYADWNDFVSKAELLAKGYACDSRDGLRICKRRD